MSLGIDLSDDPWELFTGETQDGTPFLARFAIRYRHDEPFRLAHPVRIGITVPFSWRIRRRHGRRLEVLEEEVISAAGERAELVGVITTKKVREFVLHSRPAENLSEVHASLRRTFPKYGVQMIAVEDPNWDVYDEFNRR